MSTNHIIKQFNNQSDDDESDGGVYVQLNLKDKITPWFTFQRLSRQQIFIEYVSSEQQTTSLSLFILFSFTNNSLP